MLSMGSEVLFRACCTGGKGSQNQVELLWFPKPLSLILRMKITYNISLQCVRLILSRFALLQPVLCYPICESRAWNIFSSEATNKQIETGDKMKRIKLWTDMFYIFLTWSSFTFLGVIRLTPNVALRGRATQSSTRVNTNYAASPFVASHANDGNIEAAITITHGACSHTNYTTSTWWQVDLLTVYEIHKVAVTEWKGLGK